MNFLRIVLFSCLLFCSSCEKSVDPQNDKTELKKGANAGEDQVSYVGSYAMLDASKSIISDTVDFISWISDPGNPLQDYNTSIHKFTEPTKKYFYKEGVYRFILKVECKNGSFYSDTTKVTVKPRQSSVIEDTCLEMNIRLRLKLKEGPLSVDKLQMLDSLFVFYSIPGRETRSLKGLENCTNLKYLELGFQKLTDLRPLSNLNKLEYLSLTQNRTIEDISPLSNLINLKKLDLGSNLIRDISPLANMTKLTYLDLSYNLFNDISPLSNLINMDDLNLDGVGMGIAFKSIEPLKNMTKLRYLELGERGISDLTPMENLTELIYLELMNNNITSIGPVVKMKKLIRLEIPLCKVNDIKGLSSLENLDYLDATNNQIKDISELQYMKKITLIGLAFNQIEDLSPVVNNPNIGHGVDLYVTRNPLSGKSLNEYIPALINRGVAVYNWK